jgi:hypothetical protein
MRHDTAISQLTGNTYVIDLSRNRYLTPNGSDALSVQNDSGGIVVGDKEAPTR